MEGHESPPHTPPFLLGTYRLTQASLLLFELQNCDTGQSLVPTQPSWAPVLSISASLAALFSHKRVNRE